MADIRTKDVIKGTIKTLEKGVDTSNRIKTAYVETKDKAEKSVSSEEASPGEYAQGRVSESSEKLAKAGAYEFDRQGRKGIVETRNNVRKAKEYFENKQAGKIKGSAGGNNSPTEPTVRSSADSSRSSAPQRAKARQVSKNTSIKDGHSQDGAKKLAEKNIRSAHSRAKSNVTHATQKTGKGMHTAVGKSGKTIKSAGKGTVKTAGRSVKTAQQTARTTVKTAQTTAKTAQRTAQATVKATQTAARAAKAAAKATVEAARVTAKATLAVIKAILVAAKALVAAIAAGGWIAVVILLLICFIGLLIASPFGMFFSGDAAGGTSPIREVVAQTSNEFSNHVMTIVNNNPHDEMRMTVINRGHARADNWMDVLAIFAVSTASQDSSGADVVLMDETKAAKIREIFWEMVDVQHRIETESHEEPILDEDGNDTGDTTTITKTILLLEITFKGAAETADAKGFTRQQKEIVNEMLNGEYDEMFRELIGNIGLVSMTGDGSGAVGTGDLLWPVPASDYVTSPFGSRVDPFTGEFSTHLGIDISGGSGTPIVASDAGTVVSTSVDGTYGIHALIDHGNGFSTLYAHMSSSSVAVGDTVEQGQQIGGMGETGRARGVHLHYEVWQGGGRVEPLQYFENFTTAW